MPGNHIAPTSRRVPLADAAAYLHCSVDTLRRRIRDGRLTGYRFGTRLYVDLDQVDALMRPYPTAALLTDPSASSTAEVDS